MRTEFTVEAKLKYENLQLFVVDISVNTEKDVVNETLSNFVNSTINASKSKYSLNQALTLINDYKDFANKPTDEISLCDRVSEEYHANVISCDTTKIMIESKYAVKDATEPVVYTFTLNNK
ncbi:hypothetical protein IKN40_04205 [bacterium]|nr:hypothetical protein [bacterium]